MKVITWIVAAFIFPLPAIGSAATYTITELGPGIGLGINSAGDVVGDADGQPFVNIGGVTQYLPARRATGINDSGQIVGSISVYNAEIGGPIGHPYLYSDGVFQDLGTLTGSLMLGTAVAINNIGQVVGISTSQLGILGRPFLYSEGVMQDLGTLGGVVPPGTAFAINNSGQVVGHSPTTISNRHAFLYSDGVMHDLGTLTGPSGESTAQGINDNGIVVGWSGARAFLFDGSMHDLGTLDGGASRAWDINLSGQVVGDSVNNNTPDLTYTHAFLYSGGTMLDLNTLIDPSSGWILDTARGINDSGQIAGSGFRVGDEFTRYAVLLTPVPEPSSFVLAALGLIALVVWRRRKR